VALDVEDVRWTREGMVLNIRVFKTDQEGRGIGTPAPVNASPTPSADSDEEAEILAEMEQDEETAEDDEAVLAS
jgi:hypothetical protein